MTARLDPASLIAPGRLATVCSLARAVPVDLQVLALAGSGALRAGVVSWRHRLGDQESVRSG